jgi:hypothetical protein
MPFKSGKVNRPFSREQAINFDNNFAEQEVNADNAPDANNKKDGTRRRLNSHLAS